MVLKSSIIFRLSSSKLSNVSLFRRFLIFAKSRSVSSSFLAGRLAPFSSCFQNEGVNLMNR